MEERKEDFKSEAFVKNSVWNALAILFAKIGGMLFVVILARFLLPEKFGIYTLALAIAIFLFSLTNIAMNQTVSRYVSDSLKKNNKVLAGSYFKFVSKLKKIFSIITFLLLAVLAYPLSMYVFNKPDLLLPLILFGAYVIFLSIQNLYETLFFIIGKVKLLTLKEIVLQSVKILVCLGLFLLFNASLPSAIFALIFSSFITILFMKFYLKKHLPFLFSKSKENFNKKKINKFMKNSVMSSVFTTLFDNIDMMLLGIFVSSAYVGYYAAAALIIAGFFGLMSLSNLSLPLFTQINKGKTKLIFESLFKYLSIISIPIIFGIFIFGKYVLRILYGYEYLEATIPLIVLSILVFESPIAENLKSFILSKEKPEIIARITLISIGINIILSLIIISYLSKISLLYAIIGAASCLVVSRLIILISLSIYIKKNFEISYNTKFLFKPIFSSILMVVPLLLINSKIPNMNWAIGIIEVILGFFIYFTSMLIIGGIKREDLAIIKKIFIKDNRFFHTPLLRKFFVPSDTNQN